MDMDLEALAVVDMLIEAELLRVTDRLPGTSTRTFMQHDDTDEKLGTAGSLQGYGPVYNRGSTACSAVHTVVCYAAACTGIIAQVVPLKTEQLK